jgi:hypothetical protein
MSGYNTYRHWQRIEEQADLMGFRLAHAKNGSWSSGTSATGWGGVDSITDSVAVYPKEDSLVAFARDAELFAGTFNQVETWLTGWARARQYDHLVGMTDNNRRKKYEDKELERQRLDQRLEKERLEKRQMFAIMSNKTEEQVDKLVKRSKA